MPQTSISRPGARGARLIRFFGSLLACLLSSLFFWGSAEAHAWPAKYDGQIQASVKKWWLDLPEWQLLKAQLIQESALNPDAVSPVGAEGLGQAMPKTWQDAIHALGWPTTASRRDSAYAIEGAAWYQAKQRLAWQPQGRTGVDRNDLGLASYNAGLGSIIKAQTVCNNARLWPQIAPCLTQITGPGNAKQTTDYVVRINGYWRELTK